ncbi:hypothetical protein ACO0K0_18965 [Undibacterium sp. SXout11W]|uniref:hypothetical protein n=1 Tax=Undibacterium sp. SXout11W TaxID=3413050 RepID=UPI003BF1A7BA
MLSNKLPSVQFGQRHATQSLPMALVQSFVVRGWKAGVALLTALSFALLISTAATHHHANSIEDQACSLCSAISDKLDHVTPTTQVPLTLQLFAYTLQAGDAYLSDFAAPSLLPPSCGPPALV